jgi:hypothetical protein
MWSVLAICLPGLAQNRTILRNHTRRTRRSLAQTGVKYDRVNYGRDP